MPRTRATVPPDTPGTTSADPIANPRASWAGIDRGEVENSGAGRRCSAVRASASSVRGVEGLGCGVGSGTYPRLPGAGGGGRIRRRVRAAAAS
ncbi:hypothetical protein GCM10025883_33190 [Mobilicoccus caccae]|uniref:Uncharacterized protein n=1 Tax=Mobilicoccus caccae TaxID=1859295 RepID=A0ABQ6ITJ9_9MICO|nr:hypothetical protein GCM10025883_33190 [Mobilicoccus caccae]